MSGQFRAVVAADELRVAAAGGDRLEDVDSRVGVDAAGHVEGEGFAGVLVDQVEGLEQPPVGGGVELEVGRHTWFGYWALRWSAGTVEVLVWPSARLRWATWMACSSGRVG